MRVLTLRNEISSKIKSISPPDPRHCALPRSFVRKCEEIQTKFSDMKHNKIGCLFKLLKFTEKLLISQYKKSSLLSSRKHFSCIFFFFFFLLFAFTSLVENIEQFDAAREFLKELDISDYVWIGLMRPSNADQFSWT